VNISFFARSFHNAKKQRLYNQILTPLLRNKYFQKYLRQILLFSATGRIATVAKLIIFSRVNFASGFVHFKLIRLYRNWHGLSNGIHMFLFSTIIYFGNNPVGYDVYREEDSFQFKPAIDSHSNFKPPIIIATYSKQVWLIEGPEDKETVEQVRKIIKLNEMIAELNVAS
jgi:hypothetical protein